jgi:hypothetical protein
MLLIGFRGACRTLCLACFGLGVTVEKAAVEGANSSGECHSSGKTDDVQQNAPSDWVRLHYGEMRMV